MFGNGYLETCEFSDPLIGETKMSMIEQGFDFSVALNNKGDVFTAHLDNLRQLSSSKAHNRILKSEHQDEHIGKFDETL